MPCEVLATNPDLTMAELYTCYASLILDGEQ